MPWQVAQIVLSCQEVERKKQRGANEKEEEVEYWPGESIPFEGSEERERERERRLAREKSGFGVTEPSTKKKVERQREKVVLEK